MSNDKKIVVVDDDAKVIIMVEKVLTELGFMVLSANEGKKALELVKQEKPVLLISDILQPGIDGIGLCQSIKEDPQLEDIKVILMSGVYKQTSLKREIMGTTSDAFIEKPLENQQLKDLVEKVLKS
ncbi:PleD family two-component system response regulator [Acidobacteriota bacterium]